jgi:Spy/CpxP family protein refolding chaperone
MKQLRLFAAALMLCIMPLAFAQSGDQSQEQGEHRHGRGGMRQGMGDPDQHLKMLTEQLNLTQDQQDRIRPILQEQHTKMQQSMQNGQKMSQEDRRAEMKKNHDETVSRVREVLNDDQKKKFDTMQKNMMEHHHGKGHGDHDHDHGSDSSKQ